MMKNNVPFIVKVQRSLSSTDKKTWCLIYNKDRSIQYQTDDKEEVKALLRQLKKDPKAYFEAIMIPDNAFYGAQKIQIEKRIKPQNW